MSLFFMLFKYGAVAHKDGDVYLNKTMLLDGFLGQAFLVTNSCLLTFRMCNLKYCAIAQLTLRHSSYFLKIKTFSSNKTY